MLSENIADLAGLRSRTTPGACRSTARRRRLDGFTGDQQFFIGFAQSWRDKTREPALRQQVITDGHAPDEYRADTVRNLDAWYKAFDVKPGEKLYLAPDSASGSGRANKEKAPVVSHRGYSSQSLSCGSAFGFEGPHFGVEAVGDLGALFAGGFRFRVVLLADQVFFHVLLERIDGLLGGHHFVHGSRLSIRKRGGGRWPVASKARGGECGHQDYYRHGHLHLFLHK